MKTLLTVSLTLLCFNAALAQKNTEFNLPMADKGTFEIGFNIGLNLATVTTPQSTYYYNSFQNNYTYKVGMNLGVSAEYYFSEKWSIKTKLIFDPKGWGNDYIQGQNGNDITTTVRMNYITIPLLADFHFGRKKNWYLHFGPYVGILLNASETALNTDIKPYLTTTDFGLALGIGVKIPLTDKLKLFIEDDGQAGLVNILNSNPNNSGTATNTRSALNVGILLSVK